jgi:hypothetical protein
MSQNHLKGINLEKKLSAKIHLKAEIPVLISAKVLRIRGAGQVDLCSYHKGRVFLYEVKNSGHISMSQVKRLRISADFLAKILNSSVIMLSTSLNQLNPF